MVESHTILLAEIPIGGLSGEVWNLLHGVREDLCEALLECSETTPDAHRRQELLQARLQTIDDALDRLMSVH